MYLLVSLQHIHVVVFQQHGLAIVLQRENQLRRQRRTGSTKEKTHTDVKHRAIRLRTLSVHLDDPERPGRKIQDVNKGDVNKGDVKKGNVNKDDVNKVDETR